MTRLYRFSLPRSHRYVAESNFTLHEMHCRRFLCVCPDCEETVPKEHLEQHRQEQHTLVQAFNNVENIDSA